MLAPTLLRRLLRVAHLSGAYGRPAFARGCAGDAVRDANLERAARFFQSEGSEEEENSSRVSLNASKDLSPPTVAVHTAAASTQLTGLLSLLEENKVTDVCVVDARDEPVSADEIVFGTTMTAAHGLAVGRRLSREARGSVPGGAMSVANVVSSSNKKSIKVRRSKQARDAGGGRWVAIKVSRVLVHLMTPAARAEMDLDGLWVDPHSVAHRNEQL